MACLHHRMVWLHTHSVTYHVSQLVSWSLTSLFSTDMAISETNGHSLQRTPLSPLFSCRGLSPWSSCAQELFEIIVFFRSRRTRPGRGSNRSSAPANVTLYCTWRPSGLTIGLHGQGSRITYLPAGFPVAFPEIYVFLSVLLLWQLRPNCRGFPLTLLSLAISQLLVQTQSVRLARRYWVTRTQSQHLSRFVIYHSHSLSFDPPVNHLRASSTLGRCRPLP